MKFTIKSNNTKQEAIKSLDRIIELITNVKNDLRDNLTPEELEYIDSFAGAGTEVSEFLSTLFKMTNQYESFTGSWDYFDRG